MENHVTEEIQRRPMILIIDMIVFGFSVITSLLAVAADLKFKNDIVKILTESFWKSFMIMFVFFGGGGGICLPIDKCYWHKKMYKKLSCNKNI